MAKLLIFAAIFLTESMIQEALPVGTTRTAAEEYLISQNASVYYTSRDERYAEVHYDFEDDGIGYISASISDVPISRWLPFFKKAFTITIGISNNNTISKIDVQQSAQGQWP